MRTESEIRDIFAQCVEACKKYNEFEAIANDKKLLLDGACGDITPRNMVQPSKNELWSRMVCLRNEVYDYLKAANLSPLQYRIMIMRYMKGMPWKAIYRALKKTKGYVLTEHRKALNKVARCGK